MKLANETEVRHFLTVDWCGVSGRGVFCRKDGQSFSADEPLDRERIEEILWPFSLVLNPESTPMGEEELAEYRYFTPLSEFKGEYGIARKAAVDAALGGEICRT